MAWPRSLAAEEPSVLTRAESASALPDQYIVRLKRPLSNSQREGLREKGLLAANLKPLDDEQLTYLVLGSNAILIGLKNHPAANESGEAARRLLVQCEDTAAAALRLCAFLAGQKITTVYVEPNYLWFAAASTDPNHALQWALPNIGVDQAHGRTKGVSATGREIIIAVVDTGVDLTHEDLAGQLWTSPAESTGHPDRIDGPPRNGVIDDLHGANYSQAKLGKCHDYAGVLAGHPCDNVGHGTSVASIASAATGNHKGIAGIAPGAKIMAVKFISTNNYDVPDCSGVLCGSSVDGAKAIDYSVRMQADIINLSWGGYAPSQHVCAAIARAKARGILVIAAAGNDGTDIDLPGNRFYPASCKCDCDYGCDNVISVQANTKRDKLWSSSNYGDESVDIAAPGEKIYAARLGNDYTKVNGTSMSAPHVSGAFALVKSLAPTWDYKQLKSYVIDSADHPAALAKMSRTGARLNLDRATAAPILALEAMGQPWSEGQIGRLKWRSLFSSSACPYADFELAFVDETSPPIVLKTKVDWLDEQLAVDVPIGASGRVQLIARCEGTHISATSPGFTIP